MKIVHICLGCFFPDGFTYQENLLPKFHKQLGYDVEVIASLATFDKNGKSSFVKKGSIYINEYDIKVTRLDYKKPERIYRKLKRYVGTYNALEEANPDILFVHGCQFMDIDIVVKYIKNHPNIKTYVDNHADFSNSGTNWLSKNLLHKVLWRHAAQIIEPHTTRFYGVLPARVDWLVDMYKLPKSKCKLLVMGADDDKVKEATMMGVKKQIREKYGILKDDFLIMTGGKIDPSKAQTLQLMEAVAKINNPKVKLIVFGSVTKDLQERLNEHCVKNKVLYIGWVQSDDSYKYFASADLIVFPGRHSVFWEQVAGLGIPMLCKYWEGTAHVDLGGNVIFLKEDTVEEIQSNIQRLLDNPEEYERMLLVAQGNGKRVFSYKEIARRSIQV